MNRADVRGNGQFLGPDLFFDDIMAMGAKKTYMSTEQIVETTDFPKFGPVHTQRIPRMYVTGVVDAPMGAHFTECPPDYERDETFQREYAATARDEDAWKTFKSSYIDLDSHAEYVKAINARGQK
jgi:glutaconate CoA-transferase subunit A